MTPETGPSPAAEPEKQSSKTPRQPVVLTSLSGGCREALVEENS